MNLDLTYKAQRLVNTETFECPQDELVDELLSRGIFRYDDIINLYGPKGSSIVAPAGGVSLHHNQIDSWIPASHFFSNLLIKFKEPVLRNTHGNWWGRTNKDTPPFQDPVIIEITKHIYEMAGV